MRPVQWSPEAREAAREATAYTQVGRGLVDRMTQMPLWGKPDPPRQPPTLERGEVTFRAYKGKPVTCFLCVIDIARGKHRRERGPARYEVRSQDWSWLVCTAHNREVRTSPGILRNYLSGGTT